MTPAQIQQQLDCAIWAVERAQYYARIDRHDIARNWTKHAHYCVQFMVRDHV